MRVKRLLEVSALAVATLITPVEALIEKADPVFPAVIEKADPLPGATGPSTVPFKALTGTRKRQLGSGTVPEME